MTTRTAKLVPWYHQRMDQCSATTARKERCKFSASWKVPGMTSIYGGDMTVCKPNADMLTMEGYQIRRIRPKKVNLEREQHAALQSVS